MRVTLVLQYRAFQKWHREVSKRKSSSAESVLDHVLRVMRFGKITMNFRLALRLWIHGFLDHTEINYTR